jgi:ribosomal protein S18 acetylase RimI-like enzyme
MKILKIRPAGQDDLGEVYKISLLAHRQYLKTGWIPKYEQQRFMDRYTYSDESFRKFSRDYEPYQTYLAELDGRPAGFISFCRAGKVLWLASIFVLSGNQNCGVGSSLLEQYSRHAKTGGSGRLSVLKSNKKAIKFYEKHGFKYFKDSDKLYFGAEQVIMTRAF